MDMVRKTSKEVFLTFSACNDINRGGSFALASNSPYFMFFNWKIEPLVWFFSSTFVLGCLYTSAASSAAITKRGSTVSASFPTWFSSGTRGGNCLIPRSKVKEPEKERSRNVIPLALELGFYLFMPPQ